MPSSPSILVIDLAYGDCGKGTVIDALARRHAARAVVRFNGGPQAAHNVVTADGRHHTFSQFGAASFVPGVRTLLSRFMLVEPYALLNEAEHLRQVGVGDALGRLTIDARCPVITPCHQAANRLRELARGSRAHGTCGMGIGETMQDLIDHPAMTLRAADLADRRAVLKKLRAFRDLKMDQLRGAMADLRDHPKAGPSLDTLADPTWLDAAADNYAHVAAHATLADEAAFNSALCEPGVVLFEAAQGVLLDENFGFHPHTTWSTTTFANADALLDESSRPGPRVRLGVLRSYATRHGAGPLVSEDPSLRPLLPEPHNHDAGWQGRFRVGPFDAVAARYALAVAGPVDSLAVTHLDRLPHLPGHICTAYESAGPEANEECFVRRAGRITDLRARVPGGLDYQERLTRALLACRPIYDPARCGDAEALLERIAGELGFPVGIASFGPRADDKQFRRVGSKEGIFPMPLTV